MESLPSRENHFNDPFRWFEWIFHASPICSLACAVVAAAAGATYLICKKLPDYTEIV